MGEAREEEELLMNMPPSTTLPSPPNSHKKDSKFDKLAYLEENREAKIKRYLVKK